MIEAAEIDIEVQEDREECIEWVLDWLCWSYAVQGQDNYPPDDRAEDSVEAMLEDIGDDLDDEELLTETAREVGTHREKYLQAMDFFDDLEAYGYNPKVRAQRHIALSRKRDLDLPDIDWTWRNPYLNKDNGDDDAS